MTAAARPLAGRRALVTGASSGIGLAIAHRLAARGADLAISARRVDKLETAAGDVAARHGVRVDIVAADLGTADGAAAAWTGAAAGGAIDLLINNAGFGYFRPFATVDWARDAELVQVNVTSLLELCHRFVAHHRAHPPDHPVRLMNVASTVAFQAVPNFAVYAASKAFVRSFTEALHYELRGTPISATCVCPGGTDTGFHGEAGKGGTAAMMPADKVAEIGVRAMLRGHKTVVTGWINKLATMVSSHAPSGLTVRGARLALGAPPDDGLPGRGGNQ